ncbi:MAG TPA: hypothetical protein VK789_30605 [Bryobacteraceae bacterium]|nr:hypothetical protein [Bryobacteraceae bacterium]
MNVYERVDGITLVLAPAMEHADPSPDATFRNSDCNISQIPHDIDRNNGVERRITANGSITDLDLIRLGHFVVDLVFGVAECEQCFGSRTVVI